MPTGSDSRKTSTPKKIVCIVVGIICVGLMIFMIMQAYIIATTPKPLIWGPHLNLQVKILPTSGDWEVTVLNGGFSNSNLNLVVVDPSRGNMTVNSPLTAGETADFRYINKGSTAKLDAGDIIIFKASSPNIKSGYKYSFVRDGENTIEGPKELP